jgi:hypothetical protein
VKSLTRFQIIGVAVSLGNRAIQDRKNPKTSWPSGRRFPLAVEEATGEGLSLAHMMKLLLSGGRIGKDDGYLANGFAMKMLQRPLPPSCETRTVLHDQ